MSKLTDIKSSIKNMFKKKEQHEEQKAENPSMIEGEQPKIFGVRRGVVVAISSGILVTFFLATWWSLEPTTTKTAQPKQEAALTSKPQDVADRTGLPNGYDNMADYERKKNNANAAGQRNVAAVNRVNQQSNQNQPQNQTQVFRNTEAPQISSRQYTPMYPTPYGVGMGASVPQPTSPQAEDEKEKYNAAIAFAIGQGKNDDATAATETSAAATSTSANTAYTVTGDTALQAGTIIPAILMTGINSDIGGQVVAQIQADVYDSLSGSNLLIPVGSRLIGEYSGGAANGQSRVGLKWNMLLLPNGGSWSLGDSMVAVDGAGYAGVAGKVNNHTSKMLSAGAFTSALAALGNVAAGNTSSTNNNYNAGELATQGAMSNLLNTASSLFQKNMNIQPTITIEPGYEFNIFITKAISLG